ncbi:hypothetical protein N665_0250s0001 [Sinapis alba]|nr:hypothetical protein N665_0250s0001 [Sinapis alba]
MRDGFGMMLREIKHVADRVEVVAEMVEALEQLAKNTKGTASNEAPHTPSELFKRTDEFGVNDLLEKTSWKSYGKSFHEMTYAKSSDERGRRGQRDQKGRRDQYIQRCRRGQCSQKAENTKANAAKEVEEPKANAAKEAEETIAAKETEEANTAKAAKAAKTAKKADAAKAAKEADAVKAAKETEAPKEAKAAKTLRDTKAVKEARDTKSAEDAKAAKEAREAKESRDAKEAKEVKEAEEDEEDKASKRSIVIIDKQKPTASDLETEETRRLAKSETGLANVRARSERERKLASSQQSPFHGNNTAKSIIPNKKIGRGYDPFALPVDKHKSSALTNWLKKDRWYRIPPKKKAPQCPNLRYWTLRTPLEWLTDSHMDAFINVLRKRYTNDPHMFRSERMCILDHAFAQWWMSKYPDWVSSEPDANDLGRRLPGGRRIYTEALHIVIGDIIVGCIRKAQLDQVMAPFVNMVLYLLVECAATVEERCKYSLEPFTYEVANAPQCESGDCGLFTLKYIECHALCFPFSGSLNPKNSKAIREKMAVDIFEEIPDAHQT